MGDFLTDYFKLPESLAHSIGFENPSGEPGYFQFGQGVTCFGQCAIGTAKRVEDANLHEAQMDSSIATPSLCIPFAPPQIIENLRREHYMDNRPQGSNGLANNKLVRKTYYSVREILPISVRRYFQQYYLKDWKKLAFPHWPVDSTVDNIHTKLLEISMSANGIKKVPFIWFWPNGAAACAIMTHDVEAPPGRDFCGALMDMDDSQGIKSSFQVVPEVRYAVNEEFLQGFRDRGFEINVHDLNHDGKLFQEREEFLRRAVKINQYAKVFGSRGFRAGAMYRNQEWFDAFEFSYDMSVPNIAHLEPQRGGCCTVMPYFIGELVELPLTMIQDYSLFHILREFSIELWRKQAELILQRNGLLTFITHPDYLIESRARQVYKELLAFIAELRDRRNVWVPIPGDVERWWRNRSKMRLVPDGNSWRIEGPGREQARIAYATIQGNQLSYSLNGQA